MTARARVRAADPRIELLLEVMDQAFDQKAWHGTTLRGSLRGVTPDEAQWRPAPGRHNIWELALHAAYWKYAVRRRLAGEAMGSFDRKPSNWPEVPQPADLRAWRRDVALLEAEHRKLRDVVRAMPPVRLDQRSPKGVWRNVEEIHGIAAHDLYHTGQIQLIKRLMR
ncbi:MAG TPA: DinB family protein [Gemmatimonadales bacterium]|nr:DinB family protein [Gemmatimonadales bacterium]